MANLGRGGIAGGWYPLGNYIFTLIYWYLKDINDLMKFHSFIDLICIEKHVISHFWPNFRAILPHFPLLETPWIQIESFITFLCISTTISSHFMYTTFYKLSYLVKICDFEFTCCKNWTLTRFLPGRRSKMAKMEKSDLICIQCHHGLQKKW